MAIETPKSWDNVSNNHWVKKGENKHWLVSFFNFILIIIVFIMTLLLFGLIFFFIAIPFALIYYWISESEGLYNFILISITVFPTLIASGYTIYGLLRVRNTGGPFYHSSMKTGKISRNQIVKEIPKFFEENGFEYKQKYFWVMGTRWYIYTLRKQRIKFKMVVDGGRGSKLFNFHIGPVLKHNELDANDLRDKFSEWAQKRIRPIVGTFYIYEADNNDQEVKL